MDRRKVIDTIKENIRKIEILSDNLKAVKNAIDKCKINGQIPWIYIELFYGEYVKYLLDVYKNNYEEILTENKYDNFKKTIETLNKEILNCKTINLKKYNLNNNLGNPKKIDKFINILNKIEENIIPRKDLLIEVYQKLKICIIAFTNYLDNMSKTILLYLKENDFKK